MTLLNPHLLIQQQVTPQQQENLHNLYSDIESLFARAKLTPTPELAAELTELEYQLQDNWNFPRDSSYHKYWIQLPHCTCPITDNLDRIGVAEAIYSNDCPYHGGFADEA